MTDTNLETTIISRRTLVKGEVHLTGPAIVGGRIEDFEFHRLHQVGDVDQFERVAQIGFVARVALHRLVERQRWELR